jgi:hypothetical protein
MVDNGFKDSDKLKALQILLKSIGMDKYEQEGISGGNWEDALLKASEVKADEPKVIEGDQQYAVTVPEMPESLKKSKAKEKEVGKGLYE